MAQDGPRTGGLVLARYEGQGFLIGDSIVYIEQAGRQVKLRIVAPPSVPIIRLELFERSETQARQLTADAKRKLDEIAASEAGDPETLKLIRDARTRLKHGPPESTD